MDHICPLVCGRTLSCGLHRCEGLCHTGNCNRCHRVSFDELRCQCGTQVIYPPVPCGTRPPECTKPCTRTRPCGHPQQHNCHSDASCPPCTILCEKHCYGKHELRKNIPCHVTEVSCGKSCGRALKCGKHTCPITCHKGSCLDKCTQPCPELRPECGHPCALPCHQGRCPSTSCREKIKVQCQVLPLVHLIYTFVFTFNFSSVGSEVQQCHARRTKCLTGNWRPACWHRKWLNYNPARVSTLKIC